MELYVSYRYMSIGFLRDLASKNRGKNDQGLFPASTSGLHMHAHIHASMYKHTPKTHMKIAKGLPPYAHAYPQTMIE